MNKYQLVYKIKALKVLMYFFAEEADTDPMESCNQLSRYFFKILNKPL